MWKSTLAVSFQASSAMHSSVAWQKGYVPPLLMATCSPCVPLSVNSLAYASRAMNVVYAVQHHGLLYHVVYVYLYARTKLMVINNASLNLCLP